MNESPDMRFWRGLLLALAICLPLLAVSCAALAGDKTPSTTSEVSAEADSSSASDSSALSDAVVTATHRALGVGGSTAPIPIQPADCWKPKSGLFKRGTRWIFGAFEISSLAEFDAVCAQWTKDVLELQVQLERERTRRMRAEIELTSELSK